MYSIKTVTGKCNIMDARNVTCPFQMGGDNKLFQLSIIFKHFVPTDLDSCKTFTHTQISVNM